MSAELKRILEALAKRTSGGMKPGRMAGDGIGLASAYISGMASCVGSEACAANHVGTDATSYAAAVKSGRQKPVYGADDLVVVGGKTYSGDAASEWGSIGRWEKDAEGEGVDGPKVLMEFENVLTSTRRDRDRDVLESEGAELDMRMPLLWQHLPFSPIGRMVEVVSRDKNSIRTRCAIADVPLGRDAVVLVEFGALRISHGFIPLKFEPLKRSKDEDDDGPLGWHILRFKVVEVSLVSVPSNEDAIIEAHSRGKLTHPLFKGVANTLRRAKSQTVVVPAGVPGNPSGSPIIVNVDLGGLLGGKTRMPKGKKGGRCKCSKLPKRKGVVDTHEPATAEGDWDHDAALARVAEWAGIDADPMPEGALEKYASAFGYVLDDAEEGTDPYRLLHHDVSEGELVVVFGGVEEAMGLLLEDGDGGLIPEGDRSGVYEHLAKHYEQFGKTPPDFEEKEEGEEEGEADKEDEEEGKGKKPPKKRRIQVPKKGRKGKKGRKSDDGAGESGEMKEEDLQKLDDAMEHASRAMKTDGVPTAVKTMLERAASLVREVIEEHKEPAEEETAEEGGSEPPEDEKRRKGRKRISKEDGDRLDEAKEHLDGVDKEEGCPKLAKTFARRAAGLVGEVSESCKAALKEETQDIDEDDQRSIDRAAVKLIAVMAKGKLPQDGILGQLKAVVDAGYASMEEKAMERLCAAT